METKLINQLNPIKTDTFLGLSECVCVCGQPNPSQLQLTTISSDWPYCVRVSGPTDSSAWASVSACPGPIAINDNFLGLYLTVSACPDRQIPRRERVCPRVTRANRINDNFLGDTLLANVRKTTFLLNSFPQQTLISEYTTNLS